MIAVISNIYLLDTIMYLLKLIKQKQMKNNFAYSFLFRVEMNKIQKIRLA